MIFFYTNSWIPVFFTLSGFAVARCALGWDVLSVIRSGTPFISQVVALDSLLDRGGTYINCEYDRLMSGCFCAGNLLYSLLRCAVLSMDEA